MSKNSIPPKQLNSPSSASGTAARTSGSGGLSTIAGPTVPAISSSKRPTSREGSQVVTRVAGYARTSTDLQRESSLDDQLEACRRTLQGHGLAIDGIRIFKDEAISGKKSATASRAAYQDLRRAIRNDEIDVLVCDQQCRLARNASESLTLFEELKTHRVRLITADGFDSDGMTAELLFGIKSIFNAFFLDETRHRVQRSMAGDFERGAMVTAVPYGYEIERSKDGKAQWVIHDEQAAIMRDVYQKRRQGMSTPQIAATLNARGIPTPNPDKSGSDRIQYWRHSSLWRMIRNPIYYGMYTVRLVTGKDAPGTVSRVIPELAIVSHAEWLQAQTQSTNGRAGKGSGTVYGGVKHVFTGLIECGTCGTRLSVHNGKSNAGSMNCVQCENATRVAMCNRPVWHLSVKGIRHLLHMLLTRLVQGDALKLFHDKLRERLEGGHQAELQEAKAQFDKAQQVKARLLRLMDNLNLSDADLTERYQESCSECLVLQRRVADLEVAVQQTDIDAIHAQLGANLEGVIEQFLMPSAEPHRVNAILKSVFPVFKLVYKPNRYRAVFEIHLVPGALVACATNTALLIQNKQVLHLCLITSGSRSPTWSVHEMTPSDMASVYEALNLPMPDS